MKKKRLLSMLLSVVMLLTLLSVSAFAADLTELDDDKIEKSTESVEPGDENETEEPDEPGEPDDENETEESGKSVKRFTRLNSDKQSRTEPVSGKIEEVHFYASADNAKKAVEDLTGHYKDGTVGHMANISNVGNNSVVVLVSGLKPTQEYGITLYWGNKQLDSKRRGGLAETSKETKYICAFDLENAFEPADRPNGIQSGEYTVYLTTKWSGNNADKDTEIFNEKIELRKVTVDFGADTTPKEAISLKPGADEFYKVKDDNKHQAELWADTKDLPKLGEESMETNPSDQDVINSINALIELNDESFNSSTDHAWIYNADPVVFSWKYTLLEADVGEAVMAETVCSDYDVSVSGPDDAKLTVIPLDDTPIIKLEANNLDKHTNTVLGNTTGSTDSGYWIGFSIQAPGRANWARYGSGETPEDAENSLRAQTVYTLISEESGSIPFYFKMEDAANSKYYSVQFYRSENEGSPKTELTEIYTFEIDTSKVGILTASTPELNMDAGAAIVDSDEIAKQIEAAKLQTEIDSKKEPQIIVDASGITTGKGVKVRFPADAASQLALGTVAVVIKTPYGDVTIPKTLRGKFFVSSAAAVNRTDDGATYDVIVNPGDIPLKWFGSLSMQSLKLDAFEISLEKNKKVFEIPKDESISVSVELDKADKPTETLNLWAVFSNGEVEAPTVVCKDKQVEYSKESNQATFKITKLGTYGVARSDFMKKMDTTDEKASIVIKTTDGQEIKTLDLQKTTQPVETTESEVVIHAVEGAYLVEGNTETTISGSVNVKLDKVYTTKTVGIGNQKYTINFVKVLKKDENGNVEKLTLENGDTFNGAIRKTITNAIQGRLYLVQIQVQHKTSKIMNSSYFVLQKTDDADPYFYAPKETTANAVCIQVWELNEKAGPNNLFKYIEGSTTVGVPFVDSKVDKYIKEGAVDLT